MMNRRGDETESRTGWLPAILAILVLVALVTLAVRFDVIDKLQTLRQGFNQTIDPNTGGEALIAYNLEDGKLYYYSGSSFVAFGAGAATIFGKTFEPTKLTQEFRDYFRGQGAYQNIRDLATSSAHLLTVKDDVFGERGIGYEDAFLNAMPGLDILMMGFRYSSSAFRDVSDEQAYTERYGYEYVRGFLIPSSVVVAGEQPDLLTKDKLKRIYGYVYLTPNGRVSVDLLDEDFGAFDDNTYVDLLNKYPSSSATIIYRTALTWRDSIFVEGSHPQNIAISYTDAKTKQSVFQTVPVEKKDLYIFARIR